ncbi:cation efflux family-domain-containing protein [Amylocarpus encephaloides]|uniref:Cation efflux family-domain-containing protein n=1 Tax=Amylocarpus encephaloides TaxID=45428 RepID=A0A9P7YJC9_9HELO|nr:cation efflux family-domain-containing protein [Amylocarpus encephaloides]
MPFRSFTSGARSLRPVAPALRLNLRTHQSQQFRVLQSAAHHSAHIHSCTIGHVALRSFPKVQSFSNPLSPRYFPMAALAKTQTRSHGGHSHHHHDNTYLISTNKKDAGVRITRIGLYSNLGMAIAKGIGGYAFNSQSMIADAWHSLTDLASDILTLATVSWSLKPPTAMFPTGFGKVESLGSLGVSGMLLFGGCFMCLNSCEILYAHFFLDAHAAAEAAIHAHGHSHSHGAVGPSLHAAWLAAGTVVLKEWLYQATMKVAKERKSSVLASNAIHHRVDSLTGIVTLFAILGANFLHEAAWLDPVGGLLISLLVIKGGWGNTVSALYELADKGIDEETKGSITRAAKKGLASLSEGSEVELREVEGVKSGQNYLVDLQLAVPKSWTVEEVRKVEEGLRETVGGKVRGVRRVKVRFVPKDDSATTLFDEFISGDVSPQASPEPEEHDHDHDDGHSHDHAMTNEVDGKKSQ